MRILITQGKELTARANKNRDRFIYPRPFGGEQNQGQAPDVNPWYPQKQISDL